MCLISRRNHDRNDIIREFIELEETAIDKESRVGTVVEDGREVEDKESVAMIFCGQDKATVDLSIKKLTSEFSQSCDAY